MSSNTSKETYPFFSLSNLNSLGFGFSGSSEKPLPPQPPCIEVLISEGSTSADCSVDPVQIAEGLTLLKGRVNTSDVFGVSNSDLIPGKYEGGLKLWEGSLDLVKALRSEIQSGNLLFGGKRVLELGCGHGLPGIFAGLQGAAAVYFQDFNAEVLRCLTIPNVRYNLAEIPSHDRTVLDDNELTFSKVGNGSLETLNARFYAGDWSEIHELLMGKSNGVRKVANEVIEDLGYGVILMAETVYSLDSMQSLYQLIKKCLRRPDGVVYMAGKKHYFGVGGGTRQFLHTVNSDGAMDATLISQVADGSSNVREVWKLSYK